MYTQQNNNPAQQPASIDATLINNYVFHHFGNDWLRKHQFFPIFLDYKDGKILCELYCLVNRNPEFRMLTEFVALFYQTKINVLANAKNCKFMYPVTSNREIFYNNYLTCSPTEFLQLLQLSNEERSDNYSNIFYPIRGADYEHWNALIEEGILK